MCQGIKKSLQGLASCLCCVDDSDSQSIRSFERPLLDRSPPLSPAVNMGPKRTYGTKRSTVAAGSAMIFGSAVNSSDPVEELTVALADASIDEDNPDTTTSSITTSTTASASPSPSPLARGVSPALEPVPGLEPLIEAHRVDTGKDISVLDWLAILPPSSSITKIAEASYAEVYRITASAGSSIIKIMQLQVPSDEASYEIETANAVENVVSEIRIMNALTEVPGYVTFKGTYIVQGPPPKAIIDAYTNHLETYQEDEGSYFPHPETDFNANSTFLVLELGDAGEVLENIPIVHLNQVWDLFLGVVLAVSRAEITNEFEHRDLHENNICVRSTIPNSTLATDVSHLKFGSSGLQVTLIDYGLSRACLESGEVIYNNLESDLALFHSESTGIAGIQFDTYRRMRTHLITSTHSMYPSSWHTPDSLPSDFTTPWKTFIPYTNVLWLRYILAYLLQSYKKSTNRMSSSQRRELNLFTTSIRELSKRLNVKTKIENGAFTSAQEILAFVVASGWVTESQLESYGVDESSLCEVSELITDSEDSETDSDSTS